MSDDDDSSEYDPDDMSDTGESNDGDELEVIIFSETPFKGPHADRSLPVGLTDSTNIGLSSLSAKYKFKTLKEAKEAATKDPNCYGVTKDSDSALFTLRGGPIKSEFDDNYDPAPDLVEKLGCTSWTKDPNFLNFSRQQLLEEDCNFAGTSNVSSTGKTLMWRTTFSYYDNDHG